MNLFKTPVLIKPLGLVLTPAQIGPVIQLFVSKRTVFALDRRQMETSGSVMVTKKLELTSYASITLRNDVFDLKEGPDAYNEALEARIEDSIEASAAPAAEAEAPKKRGRKPAAEASVGLTDEQFDALFDEAMRYEYRAHQFALEQVAIEETEAVLLENTEAFRSKVEDKPDNEAKIRTKLAQIRQLVRRRGEALTALQQNGETPGADLSSVSTSVFGGDDLEDAAVGVLDNQALGSHRQTLRDTLQQIEQALRADYDWVERNIVDSYNRSAATGMQPFTSDSIEVNGVAHMDRSEAVTALFSDVLTPLYLSEGNAAE